MASTEDRSVCRRAALWRECCIEAQGAASAARRKVSLTTAMDDEGQRMRLAAVAPAGHGGCRTKPIRKRPCTSAEVDARATVRGDLTTDGLPATDEMAVFQIPPLVS